MTELEKTKPAMKVMGEREEQRGGIALGHLPERDCARGDVQPTVANAKPIEVYEASSTNVDGVSDRQFGHVPKTYDVQMRQLEAEELRIGGGGRNAARGDESPLVQASRISASVSPGVHSLSKAGARLREAGLKVIAVEELATGAEKAERRRGVLHLSDLNPDADGDGKISAFEKEVYNMFKEADVDGSGALSMREVYGVVKKAARMRRWMGLLKKLFAIAVLAIVLLLCAIGIMTAALMDAYKDTEANGSMLTTREGAVMQTSPAEYALPLIVAPVLALSQLAKVPLTRP